MLVMQVEVELSQRRACGLMELYRATCRYRRRRGEDQPLRMRRKRSHSYCECPKLNIKQDPSYGAEAAQLIFSWSR